MLGVLVLSKTPALKLYHARVDFNKKQQFADSSIIKIYFNV
jgi:hypothetical protein